MPWHEYQLVESALKCFCIFYEVASDLFISNDNN